MTARGCAGLAALLALAGCGSERRVDAWRVDDATIRIRAVADDRPIAPQSILGLHETVIIDVPVGPAGVAQPAERLHVLTLPESPVLRLDPRGPAPHAGALLPLTLQPRRWIGWVAVRGDRVEVRLAEAWSGDAHPSWFNGVHRVSRRPPR